ELARLWPSTPLGRASLANGYGPTEAVITATVHEVAAGSPVWNVPIGRVLPGRSAQVLDRQGGHVAVGVAGELCLGGILARGYLGRPEATAERFVPDPWSPEPGDRIYRTGDRVRWLASGDLEFLGRIDRQVKVRGLRIEPGEIESALTDHPALAQAAVVVAGEGVDRRLVAFVVAGAGEAVPGAAELRAFLRRTLPDSLVPGAWVEIPALPLTASGKVDRRALAALAPTPEAREGSAAPATPVEEILAGIWSEVLHVEPIGAADDFFELGGHSLLATQVQSRVREALGVELPLRSLFEKPTVAALAAEVEVLRAGSRGGEITALRPGPRTGRLPLSFSQERLWFLEQLEPGRPTYVMPAALRLAGRLDVAVLGRALAEVVRRHEALRTTFRVTDGVPHQEIRPEIGSLLPVIDLRHLIGAGAGAGEAEAERIAAAEVRRPFDLTRGPLLRVSLLWLAADEHLCLLQVHHAVADAWSLSRLVHELGRLYAAYHRGEPSPLPGLPVQYADFALWQRGPEAERLFADQVAYWRERLAGPLPVLDLPTDRPRPVVRSFQGAVSAGRLPREVTAELKALSRRAGATLFMVLLAGFDALLARLSGQDDVLVGSPIAGRNRREVEGLIGCFLNTLVLRADLAGDPTFPALLGRVREATLEAFAHQDLPFEKLLEELKPERDLSRTPLFQVFLNLINVPQEALELPGLELRQGPGGAAPSNFDLTLYAREEAGEVRFNLLYNVALFDEARADELLRQLESILAQAAARPEAGIGSYSLLTPRAAALLPRPDEALSPQWHGSVPALFSRQARRVPERTAVADPEESWSYRDLDLQSNRLAHLLRAHGVKRGDVVVLYGHRSAPLVWGVLGVLKAGAAFAILDPAYPPARQLQCLDLAAPRALIRVDAAGALPEELETATRGLPRLAIGARAGHELSGLLDGQPDGDPGVEVGPDDLAYISFTSGSTGLPKGVLGRHGPLTHFTPWMQRELGLGEADRFTLLSGLAHDPLQRDIFTPLQLGATLCIPDPAAIGVLGRIAGWMRREAVTVTHLTPAMGQLLTETVPGAPVVEVPSLRYAFLVGDVLTRVDVARLCRLAPGVTCVNFYGSTETQRAVGYHVCKPVDEGAAEAREILPLGRGMQDVQLLVLTRDRRLAGIGELGEIAIRSPHLAAGYLGDPDLTRERFLPNPFAAAESPHLSAGSDRIYRTGDLGRYRPDGELEFVARADNQVKIRGFRIEPGEIEAALARHPAVREAVVVARSERTGEKRLVAYVVAQGEPAPPMPRASELQDWLRRRLPEYMVPPAWVELAKLPVTPNGKVDRRSLPEPEAVRPELAASYVAPGNEAEQAIAEIWQEVLQVERVGRHDKFFHLGGHSLLLVRVHARLQERFGQELSIMDLFKYPDISSLAQHLTRRTPARPVAAEERTEEIERGKLRRRQRLEKSRGTGDDR
ncbi:MAG TPA: amino acid adenylation domain-containing protein, partial [Thermoanaerobaculia bacterium]|nr:amino acid adenylation domain-containing protein [Thermoanaerobaculia bacterium]